ncbi:uncharacterized protein LOC113326058 [Papaver somniferum]|uniref:uncharacterized protein LOC113326058 n=1 Tax=Papaver somniferum TaxID=3469 RepID=UPI000E6FBC97|nr:uncharacterized protein LOC113326058 [Papaver somniferum]XP_026429649.1 uncharacterized protein LOC113326058 [Papaver somniferum]XP_026429650.1 uncharacterized protein LOC113326058 [Papaver somniferum]XP_026429651.1 uncharacterized protein LOC113326058 [Papaver somniferum]
MSWYRDPQLFIYYKFPHFRVCWVNKELNKGAEISDDHISDREFYHFPKHLCLGSNKESDYAEFFSDLKIQHENIKDRMINCQGWEANRPYNFKYYYLTRADLDKPFYRLPAYLPAWFKIQEQQKAEIQTLKKQVLEQEAMNFTLKNREDKWTADIDMATKEISDLQEQLEREKNDKQALEKKILELSAKLEKSCGCVGVGSSDDEVPWMITGQPAVPSNWVSYYDLDVQTFPEDNHLNFNEVMWVPEFAEDNTTNVRANCFYRGLTFPIVAVNVAELTLAEENARFDPDVWGLYEFGGTYYAARKQFEWELLVDAHHT